MPIQSIKARQIYDSRGNPTVEVSLWLYIISACSVSDKTLVLSFYVKDEITQMQIIFA